MKLRNYIKFSSLAAFSTFAVLLSLLGSCRDDLLYDNYERDGIIRMEVAFEPLNAKSLNTRAAGNSIKTINNFAVVFFDRDGKLVKIVNQGDKEMNIESFEQDGNDKMPPGTPAGTDQAEAKTPKVVFTLEDIPDGKYRVYSVANIGKVTEEMAETEAKFKDRLYQWQDDVAENNQMFGYFTQNSEAENYGGFEAPVISVEEHTARLYSWMRRLASKVTIAFNTKGLKNDVWVYINKVTIKDIPKYCALGKVNSPQSPDSLIDAGGVLYYDKKGLVENTEGFVPSETYSNWLALTNSDETVGSHAEDAPALFFYENMQGDYSQKADSAKYNKQMSSNPKDLGILVGPKDEGWKDNVKYGTWVEVEAYYESRNPENVTAGKIIYRFMLGKDTKYNYNSERNHHFKLTLFLKGWANQADWHIEYTEEDPDILTPPLYYMPYLYNTSTTFPFKLNGDAQNCKIEIIENGWAPVNIRTDQVPSTDEYVWNKAAYEQFGPVDYPQLGFLALAQPNATGSIAKNIITDMSYSAGLDAFKALNDYYTQEYTDKEGFKYSQKERYLSVKPGVHLEGEHNEYSVTKADAGESLNYQVNLWTRNKQMINISGFSGNNPYEFYQRKAVVRITADFKLMDGTIKTLSKDVPIYQVRRLVNPKAVWRSYSNNESFHVQLMQLDSPNASQYENLKSQGSWEATIESGDKNFCYLSTTEKGAAETIIHGDTDSYVEFYINFKGAINSGETAGCVINISYHGNSCTHKILVRQGYNTPVAIVGNAKWSSFNLFACEENHNDASLSNGSPLVVPAEVTVNPLAVGSFFKRRDYTHAILIENNQTYGPLVPILDKDGNAGKLKFAYFKQGSSTREYGEATWNEITAYRTGTAASDTIYKWAHFSANIPGIDGTREYRVPDYDDYRALDRAEYGLGIIYADGATRPRKEFEHAQGFEDPNNNTQKSDLGVRAFIVYNRTTGAQICFPLGKYGMARRTQFNLGNTVYEKTINRGYLRYGDVYSPLTQALGANNIYRPIPYNMPDNPGSIYWINCVRPEGHEEGGPCLGWDMQYFSFDFSAYTANNKSDACPVKLILVE